MELSINWIAVIVAVIFSIFLAITWYNDSMFGKQWRNLTRLTPQNSEKFGAVPMIVVMFMNITTVLALAIAIAVTNTALSDNSLWVALAVGFSTWLAFSGSTLLTHNLFELKPLQLTIINSGYQLVFFIGVALIIGLAG